MCVLVGMMIAVCECVCGAGGPSCMCEQITRDYTSRTLNRHTHTGACTHSSAFSCITLSSLCNSPTYLAWPLLPRELYLINFVSQTARPRSIVDSDWLFGQCPMGNLLLELCAGAMEISSQRLCKYFDDFYLFIDPIMRI